MLYVKLVNEFATLPRKANPDDAGFDLSSCDSMIIPAKERRIVNTGIVISIPKNTYARIAPRSGLASKHGIDVLAGVVDQGYRGNIMVILYNTSDIPFEIKIGDRIAQLILESIVQVQVKEFSDFSEITDTESTRGDKGFGSSG
jgi:dUTP pyrophosphatase